MTETVWIVLIAAVALVLVVFRGALKAFVLEVTPGKKYKASMIADPALKPGDDKTPGVNDNRLLGWTNQLRAQGFAIVKRNWMFGRTNEIIASTSVDPAKPKKRPTQ